MHPEASAASDPPDAAGARDAAGSGDLSNNVAVAVEYADASLTVGAAVWHCGVHCCRNLLLLAASQGTARALCRWRGTSAPAGTASTYAASPLREYVLVIMAAAEAAVAAVAVNSGGGGSCSGDTLACMLRLPTALTVGGGGGHRGVMLLVSFVYMGKAILDNRNVVDLLRIAVAFRCDCDPLVGVNPNPNPNPSQP